MNVSDRQINISHSSGYQFEFSTPDGVDLAPGVYLDAERAAFSGPHNPGMDVSSSGRGCNTISGEFYIYELDVSTSSPSLAMDFVQYCDSTTDALRGQIRINSDVEIPYTQPLASIQVSNSVPVEGDTIELSAASSVVNNPPFTVSWVQVSGPEAEIQSPFGVDTNVVLPTDLDLGGADLVFSATVTNVAGEKGTAQREIHVSSKSDPKTYFSFQSEDGDYIGGGGSWSYSPANANITMSGSGSHVGVSISGSEWWNADFAAPDNETLEVGAYGSAQRYPFQPDGVAGLDISGDGRGCNRSYGSFEVIQLERDADTTTSFRATFEQRCESRTAPLLWGEVAVNAVDPSVPKADAGEDLEVKEGDVVNLNGSASLDTDGSISSYLWSGVDVDLDISNSNESRASFTAPALADRARSETFDVRLYIVDDMGFKAEDTVQITVTGTNKAPVAADDEFDVAMGSMSELSVLDNDQDSDGQLQLDSIEIVQQPSSGSITVRSTGVVEYRSNSEEPTTDSFSYTVLDNDGETSNQANVTVNIVEQLEPEPEPEPDQPPSEGSDTSDDSGGGSISWLLVAALLVLLPYRKVRIR